MSAAVIRERGLLAAAALCMAIGVGIAGGGTISLLLSKPKVVAPVAPVEPAKTITYSDIYRVAK